jgi:xylitol oxidase
VFTDPAAKATKYQTNWAGNLAYGADRLLQPSTIADVQAAVNASEKVRVIGSRHCFNNIADTMGTLLSLERLNRVGFLDSERSQATVEGGARYGEVGPYLHDSGYALHNTASLPHISIAGACATATHGSGKLGNLAVAVAGVELVDGRGEVVTLSREADGDTFSGVAVNLGALGVVTKLTLDLRPAFHVRQDVFCELPLSALETHFEEIMSSGYSVSVFTAWQTDVAEQVWVKSAVDLESSFTRSASLFGARPAIVKMHPIASQDPINCTEQLGVAGPSYDRLPHFRMGFTPASGNELQVEYFVPREYATKAIRVLRSNRDRLAELLLMGEIRTIAADDLWMSPCFQTPCVAFHFSFKQDWPALRMILPGLEEALAPFHPRPHWGKMFTMSPDKIQACYPRLDDFRSLQREHDPYGKFVNAFVERYIF